MSPLEFLSAVLPTSGVYCAVELSTRKREHAFVTSIPELQAAIERFDAAGHDTYFALASYTDSNSREAENAALMRSLFIDVDVRKKEGKKTYTTFKEALEALSSFFARTEFGALGEPWMVFSGGGLHFYWPLDADATIDEWRPVAERLKVLCEQQGLKIDMTVTADAARILRAPGTFNNKWKKRSEIKSTGGVFNLAEIDRAIRANLREEPRALPTAIPGKRLKRSAESALTSELLSANDTVRFKDILDRTARGAGCAQLAHYLQNAKDDGMEPLWRGLLSIAKVCEDGERGAQFLSKLHPYSEKRTAEKLAQIKGPYPCSKFATENPGVCNTCPHWGKITNPLALGRTVKTDNTPRDVTIEQYGKERVVQRPTPPRGFAYGEKGGVYRNVEVDDVDGGKVTKLVEILSYDLWAVDILAQQGDHYVHLVGSRPEGAVAVTLPQKAVVSKDDTVKALAAQNIIASYGAGNDKHLFDYVRACAEQLSSERGAVKVPGQMGWQADGSFVYFDSIYTPTGKIPVPLPGLENLTSNMQPKGTLEGWRRVWTMLLAKREYQILTMALVGFASPLMAFTGFAGLAFHVGSTQSGTGKSLCQALATGMWGKPDGLRTAADTSDVALIQRLGLLNSLPLIPNEITDRNRKNMEWMSPFLLQLTEGRGKERMESGANKERLNLATWASLALLTSNTHLTDYFTGARAHASEGEMRRFLELTLAKQLNWSVTEQEVLQSLHENYGVAGDAWVQWLVRNKETVRATVKTVMRNLTDDFGCTGDERFWVAGCAAIVSAAILVGKDHAELIGIPLKPVLDTLRSMVLKARGDIKESVRSAEDILNAYTRENYGKMIIMKYIDGAYSTTYGESGAIDHSLTKTQVCGRVEHGVVPNSIVYVIEEKQLKSFCSAMSFGYADFRRQLEQQYTVEYGKRDLLAKTRGPQMRVNAIRIIRPISEVDETPDSALPVEQRAA